LRIRVADFSNLHAIIGRGPCKYYLQVWLAAAASGADFKQAQVDRSDVYKRSYDDTKAHHEEAFRRATEEEEDREDTGEL
jgi:hypothetical protein